MYKVYYLHVFLGSESIFLWYESIFKFILSARIIKCMKIGDY